MSNREDALRLLREMRLSLPHPFFCEMDRTRKGKGFILAYLEEANSEVLAGDLAKEMGVSTARIAALLKTMEKEGLISRCNSPQDARRTIVKITPAGIQWINEAREQIVQNMELLLDKVGKDDLEEFIRVSRKIGSVMNKP